MDQQTAKFNSPPNFPAIRYLASLAAIMLPDNNIAPAE